MLTLHSERTSCLTFLCSTAHLMEHNGGSHDSLERFRDADRRKVSLQAFSIFGQILSVAYEREMMKRYIGLEGFTPEEADELKEFIIQNVFAQLGVRG